MAAGLPVAAPRVGDVAAMVASENGPLLARAGRRGGARRRRSATLAADPALRRRVGEANRAKAARRVRRGSAMIERYRALYWRADRPR